MAKNSPLEFHLVVTVTEKVAMWTYNSKLDIMGQHTTI